MHIVSVGILLRLKVNICFSCPLDVSIGEKKLSSILGELIWEELSQCIINECLLHSIPDNSSQLEKYSTVGLKLQLFFCFIFC